ncbi:hypothetical protein JCGZ_15433 [Jatropha curcas]|uniref:Dynamin-type G domain-containing protein n=1 Tax=Jatropha curcas TaxID=180498 RepID=A0A067K5S9_JATCU|nr:hypothetical protein JCGZ_15433 [Jatropha curcas]
MGVSETPLSNGDEMEAYEEVSSIALVNAKVEEDTVLIVSSYNDCIRPLLDVIDKLKFLKLSSAISLPKNPAFSNHLLVSIFHVGRGFAYPTTTPELFFEFNGKTVPTDETHIANAINLVIDEIVGNGKGISNTPLTLIVKKNGVHDLTMIDLPGITRVLVPSQLENIYEQIVGIIMEYISPEESIILNISLATLDFSICESIRMSRQVDRTGERTLAIVTKSDKAPEGLLEKVNADDVNIVLGYVCVWNRISDESYDEARKEGAILLENHPLLSKIDKSMMGIPVLAQKLTQIQATIIAMLA